MAGGHGGVQRELKQLTDAEIVRRFLRGNQVYFQANMECPIFQELKAIIVKTVGVADLLRTALASLGEKTRIAFIYGSMARAEQNAASDVDLLVVGDVLFGEVVAGLLKPSRGSGGKSIRQSTGPTSFVLK